MDMTEKVSRNDPCPCGSGKKYKNCCWGKKYTKKKLTAKWLNQPAMPNLMERTFGDSIAKTFKQQPPLLHVEKEVSSAEAPSLEKTE